MNFIDKYFRKREKEIKSNGDFWNWFVKNERKFYKTVKDHKNIEKDFLDKIHPKLEQIKTGIFYLTGMKNKEVAELILTPDGNLKNVAIIENLVEDSPDLERWKFTALKPELDIMDTNIKMGSYEFNSQNLSFYPNIHKLYPDEIDITIIYSNWNEEDENNIRIGVHIYLDNYLGELNFMTNIDTIRISGNVEPNNELIPIAKLKDYIKWRQKEFIEKYENVVYSSENATYSILELNLGDGEVGIANVNTQILKWDDQASHPWISSIEINYKNFSNNGMPNPEAQIILEKIEDEINKELSEDEGYINIGRLSAKNIRTIYFACKNFRKPSLIFQKIKESHSNQFEIEFDIYKDKYWQTFNKFIVK